MNESTRKPNALRRAPIERKHNSQGLRIGEMEANELLCHGAAAIVAQKLDNWLNEEKRIQWDKQFESLEELRVNNGMEFHPLVHKYWCFLNDINFYHEAYQLSEIWTAIGRKYNTEHSLLIADYCFNRAINCREKIQYNKVWMKSANESLYNQQVLQCYLSDSGFEQHVMSDLFCEFEFIRKIVLSFHDAVNKLIYEFVPVNALCDTVIHRYLVNV